MSLTHVAHAFMLLSAACGGAVALIAFGLRLRSAPGSPLAAALARVAPITAVAWGLALLALIAAFVGHHTAGETLLLALAGLAGLGALFGIFSGGDRADRDLAAALALALVMATLWGAREAPSGGVGQSFPFGVAAAGVLLTTFLGLVPARWRLAGMLGAAGSLAFGAWGLSVSVYHAPDLWQPVALGCAFGAGAGVMLAVAVRPDREIPPPLAFLIPLLAGGAAVLLVGRLYGMTGCALAGIGILPLAIHPARGAARLAALLAALWAGRALLQWSLGQAGLGPAGLDITQPYAFAALVAGVAFAAAPAVAAPYVRGSLAGAAAAVALAVLVPLVAIGVQADVLPALLMGMLAGGLVVGGLRADAARTLPALIAYAGAVTAIFGPRLAELGILPRPWRLIGLLAAIGIVALAAAIAAITRQAATPPEAAPDLADREPAAVAE